MWSPAQPSPFLRQHVEAKATPSRGRGDNSGGPRPIKVSREHLRRLKPGPVMTALASRPGADRSERRHHTMEGGRAPLDTNPLLYSSLSFAYQDGRL
ncbi:hypothetical protein E2C01_002065 [Portunus trituberculatus]|uniref:Uncharacterized protein n=1 Tax=Portunus trituberculatus TaxID=210409 RepID=A0A5B7CPD2_PORTR|nr:hypothetical protein [Portunus trituberculatus]